MQQSKHSQKLKILICMQYGKQILTMLSIMQTLQKEGLKIQSQLMMKLQKLQMQVHLQRLDTSSTFGQQMYQRQMLLSLLAVRQISQQQVSTMQQQKTSIMYIMLLMEQKTMMKSHCMQHGHQSHTQSNLLMLKTAK